MLFDEVHDIYLPFYYGLLSSKKESCYREAFRSIVEDLGGKFDPATIGVDFEQGFINALKTVFPQAKIVGCLFHFKQAIRKKMVEMGFPKPVIYHYMKPGGGVEVLTVLPKKDIKTVNSRGVLFVAKELDSSSTPVRINDESTITLSEWAMTPEGQRLRAKFWNYMDAQWIRKRGMIELWNLHEVAQCPESAAYRLISRTNCALERYNRSFNNNFVHAHPSLSTFVEGLYEESQRLVTKLEHLIHGRVRPPTYQDIPFPKIPDDYADWEAPSVDYVSLTDDVPPAVAAAAAAADVDVPATTFTADTVATAKKSERPSSAPTGHSPVKKIAKIVAAALPARKKSARIAGRNKNK